MWRIYAQLEVGLATHRGDPIVVLLALPELYRAKAIAADLRDVFGEAPQPDAVVAPAAEHAARLAWLTQHRPALLVAHAYTRYLGDLSGGQLLRRGAAKSLGIPESGPGLAFYNFPDVPDINACKYMFRARLDAMPVDATVAAEIVEEACWVFTTTGALLAAVVEAP